MKKNWLSVILLLALVQIGVAQNVRLGVFVNPGLSWLKSDISKIDANGTHLGINGGLVIEKPFSPHYAFTTGLSIHTAGGSLTYKDGKELRTSGGNVQLPANSSVRYYLQYIHIPAALKLRSTEIGYSTYFVELGFDPMFNVKSSATVKAPSLSKTGVGKEVNLLYLAYHASLGLEYKIVGNTSAMVGLNYMNGFTDITDNYSTATEKTVLHCFELRIGLMF